MNSKITTEEWAKVLADVTKTGAEDGKAAATWVFDGNTTEETWTAWRTMRNDGDPEVWDHYAAPLSGEWADGLTPRAILEDYDVELDDVSEEVRDEMSDEMCAAYEQAHSDAWGDEIDRAIAEHLEGE